VPVCPVTRQADRERKRSDGVAATFYAGGIASAKTPGVNGRTILLVDDDVELLRALTKVLEKEGYEVVPQPSADDAIRLVNDTRRQFDLVITDVSMPGLSGAGLLTAFKGAFPKIPVIIITAFADWGQYMDALREGAFEYLYKPIEKSDLLAAVGRALKTPA
jgi:DNA-binding NtrC family response regulator